MNNNRKYISIFCGSRNGNDPNLVKLAFELSYRISNKYGLIYGGTNIGLMNAFANGALNNNGELIGVITEQFKIDGIMHTDVVNMITAPDMHKRKEEIYKRADIYLVFPGGFGTLDELFEILTWKSLNLLDKPIIIFNYKGFFDYLILFLNNSLTDGFITDKMNDLFVIIDDFDELQKILQLR